MRAPRSPVSILLACLILATQGSIVMADEAVTVRNALFMVGGSPKFARLVNETEATGSFAPLEPVADTTVAWLRVTRLAGGTPWTLKFSAPLGSTLVPGTYGNAERTAKSGIPGLDVFGGDGFGCIILSGEFTVIELTRDDSSVLTRFAADFSLRCSQFAVSPDRILAGSIRYQSPVPWQAYSVSPTTIDFPGQAPNTVSPAQFVSLANTGTLPLDLDGSIAGLTQPEFAIVDASGCLTASIQPGSACDVGVVYAPWRASASSALLKVTRDAAPGELPIELTGRGKVISSTQLIVHSPAVWPGPASIQAIVLPEVRGNVDVIDTVRGLVLSHRGAQSSLQFPYPIYLPPGPTELISRYLGDDSSFPSDSPVVQVNVPIATRVEIASYPWFVRMGEPFQLHATIRSPGSFRLTGGTLSIIDTVTGETLVQTVVVDDLPEASVQVRVFQPRRAHRFEARYSGHGPFVASSGVTDVSVRSITTTSASASTQSAFPQQPVTIAGDVSAAVGDNPTGGTLSVRDETGAQLVSKQVTATNRHIEAVVNLSPGTHRFDVVYSGSDSFEGSASSVSVMVNNKDTVGPDQSAPIVSFTAGSTIAKKKVPLAVAFPATDAGSGVKTYSLGLSSDAGAHWKSVPLPIPAAAQALVNLKTNAAQYRFRARSTDGSGNPSSWVLSPVFRLQRLEEKNAAVTYTGTWKAKKKAKASGGRFRLATAGASAFVQFTGTQAALVFRHGPNCGKAEIYVDGAVAPIGTVDLYAAKVSWRRIAIALSLSPGLHRIEIRAIGARNAQSKGTQVPFDAVVVLN